MPKSRRPPLYIGVGGHVVSINPDTGDENWRVKLKSSASFVTIFADATSLFVGASGELFCIDPRSGEIRWHNKLKGLGMGLVAFSGNDVTANQVAMMTAAAATAAAITAAT